MVKFEECNKVPLEDGLYRCLEDGDKCMTYYAIYTSHGIDCYYRRVHDE